jgi:hypothetical protein
MEREAFSRAGVAARSGGGRCAPLPAPDFTTVQRLDTPAPPNVAASDALFEFLFSTAPTTYLWTSCDSSGSPFDRI